MEKINLIKPTLAYKYDAIKFIQEFMDNNSEINGSGSLDSNLDNYEDWIIQTENKSKGINIKVGMVPASTYFAIREIDNRIIGMINIRHKLNDNLLMYNGHIGYCVRPTERRKGHATEILRLGLIKCREIGINKVLVTCNKSNIASSVVIKNNNGIFENEILSEDNDIVSRYWIDNN